MHLPRRTMIAVATLALLAGCGEKEDTVTSGPGAGAAPAEPPEKRKGEEADWDYGGAKGPAHWGKLSREYATCGEGRRQSPIDLERVRTTNLPPLELRYRPSPTTLDNTGRTVQASYDEGSTLRVGEDRFELVQFHFHAPSDHTIRGREFPMEIHLVHKSSDDRLAVLGVMVEGGGEPNGVYGRVGRALPRKEGETAAVDSPVDAAALLPPDPGAAARYAYTGSLTTPPCTEGVSFSIFAEPVAIPGEDLERWRATYTGNHRPVQPRNGRIVRRSRGG